MLFENQYTITKDIFKSWMKLNKKTVFFRRVWLILFILCAALCVWAFVYRQEFIVYVLGILFCAYRRWVLPEIGFRKQFKLLSQRNGGEEWTRTISFSDKIIETDINATFEWDWAEISSVRVQGNLLTLILKNKSVVIRLFADSFTVGNSADFLQFLKMEHPEIQITHLR
jgi:hypothetical protein